MTAMYIITICAASLLSSVAAALIMRRLGPGSASAQARREGIILRHMELLLEQSQNAATELKQENKELLETVSELEQAIAVMLASVERLTFALERISTEEIAKRTLENVSKAVQELQSKVKKRSAKNSPDADAGS